METVSFKTPSGTIHEIMVKELEAYPHSYLTISALGSFRGDHKNGCVNVTLSDNAMKNIKFFYTHGVWPNPYDYDNKWTIPDVSEQIYAINGRNAIFSDYCDFLMLPCDILPSDEYEDPLWEDMGYEEDELDEIKNEYQIEKFLEDKREFEAQIIYFDSQYESCYDSPYDLY